MGTGKLSGEPDEMVGRGGEGGQTWDGLASHSEESSKTSGHFTLHGNWDKLLLGGSIDLSTIDYSNTIDYGYFE